MEQEFPKAHMTKSIVNLQGNIFDQKQIRTDAFYKEGKGVIFVPEGQFPNPFNVVMHIAENRFPTDGGVLEVTLH
jgi:hypothetical protein